MMVCPKFLIRCMTIMMCLYMGMLMMTTAFPAYSSNGLYSYFGYGSELLTENSREAATIAEEQLIAEIIAQMSEQEIYQTVLDLQNFQTRVYGYPGNTAAGTYLYNKLDAIQGLIVEYQGGDLRNVIATLPSLNPSSNEIYIAGAHYDSTSWDPNDAPGATDNGAGVAIVLEFARILSQYQFNHTLKFACWNHEEGGLIGSNNYAASASSSGLNIPLYVNLDSSAYDPDNRFVLDIMYNAQSTWAANMLTEHNTLYGIDFTLTYNAHSCSSDHRSFWQYGYTAVMTHEETHGPAHSPEDTADKISTLYTKKNGQLCLSLLARVTEPIDNAEAHDVEVRSVTPSKTVAAKGAPISINVTVRNNGDYSETTTVTTKVGTQTLDQRQISLAVHTSTTFSFPWNTASLPLGTYTITVTASPVQNETDLADNTRTSPPVTITIPGDTTGDFTVDIFDVVTVASAYYGTPTDPNWNPNADLNNDQHVNIYDLIIVATHYA